MKLSRPPWSQVARKLTSSSPFQISDPPGFPEPIVRLTKTTSRSRLPWSGTLPDFPWSQVRYFPWSNSWTSSSLAAAGALRFQSNCSSVFLKKVFPQFCYTFTKMYFIRFTIIRTRGLKMFRLGDRNVTLEGDLQVKKLNTQKCAKKKSFWKELFVTS